MGSPMCMWGFLINMCSSCLETSHIFSYQKLQTCANVLLIMHRYLILGSFFCTTTEGSPDEIVAEAEKTDKAGFGLLGCGDSTGMTRKCLQSQSPQPSKTRPGLAQTQPGFLRLSGLGLGFFFSFFFFGGGGFKYRLPVGALPAGTGPTPAQPFSPDYWCRVLEALLATNSCLNPPPPLKATKQRPWRRRARAPSRRGQRSWSDLAFKDGMLGCSQCGLLAPSAWWPCGPVALWPCGPSLASESRNCCFERVGALLALLFVGWEGGGSSQQRRLRSSPGLASHDLKQNAPSNILGRHSFQDGSRTNELTALFCTTYQRVQYSVESSLSWRLIRALETDAEQDGQLFQVYCALLSVEVHASCTFPVDLLINRADVIQPGLRIRSVGCLVCKCHEEAEGARRRRVVQEGHVAMTRGHRSDASCAGACIQIARCVGMSQALRSRHSSRPYKIVHTIHGRSS